MCERPILEYDNLLKCFINLATVKDIVGYYKQWNEVIAWFTQMICYNVYIPLLIKQANDVEENPGLTIFDINDPTTTVSADSSFFQLSATVIERSRSKEQLSLKFLVTEQFLLQKKYYFQCL